MKTQSDLPVTRIGFHKYGGPEVLTLEKAPLPPMGPKEVRLAVKAASLNAADLHILRASPFPVRFATGLFSPRIATLGADVAGIVEAVGPEVHGFKPGDRVFGDLSGCGFGGLATHARAPERALAPMPENLTFAQAAAVPMAAVTARKGLIDVGRLKAGEKVLVRGASGGVGHFAVQLAVALGARVTAMARKEKLAMVRTLGAHEVVTTDEEAGRGYDLILDAAAFQPFETMKPLLSPTGRYVLVGGSDQALFRLMLRGPFHSRRGGQRFRNYLSSADAVALREWIPLLVAGTVKPHLHAQVPLAEASRAFRLLEGREVMGKVVVVMGD